MEENLEEKRKYQLEILEDMRRFGETYVRPYGIDLENSYYVILGEFLRSHDILWRIKESKDKN